MRADAWHPFASVPPGVALAHAGAKNASMKTNFCTLISFPYCGLPYCITRPILPVSSKRTAALAP